MWWFFTLTSRLFGLDLENRVRSVTSTVLDGLFLYLAQMITIIRGCVAHYVWSESGNLNFWNFFLIIFGLDLEKNLQFSMDSFHKWSLVWVGVLHIMTFDLDLYLKGHLALALKIVPPPPRMTRCVACDDRWTWPISSRSLDLDFENSVRSVTFSILDRLFPYLPQIVTTIRGCVAC